MATILDCKTVQPQISEYIDGAMDNADTAWAIKLHLSSCAVCTQVAEDLTQTTRLLQALPTMETSPDFEAALARRLADQVLQPRRPSMWDSLREWWAGLPTYRTAFATAGALAAVVPAGLVVAYHAGSVNHATATPINRAAKSAVNDPALDELFNEHMTYASSEPLADSSAGMLDSPTNGAASANQPTL